MSTSHMLGRQMQVWLVPIADERLAVMVKLWDLLGTRAISDRFRSGVSWRGAISSVHTFTVTFIYRHHHCWI